MRALMRTTWFSWPALFAAGLGLRVALVCWSVVQDRFFRVRYTDVDYLVFSDAARFVWQGGSPYDRATYRYSPLMAYLLVPNEWFGPLFGKALLVCCDLATAAVLRQCCRALGYSDTSAKWRVALAYLLNPLIVNITTRGNSETITILLLALSLLGLLRKSVSMLILSAACLGLATHIRLFPALNGLPIALFLLAESVSLFSVAAYGALSIGIAFSASAIAYWACGVRYLDHALFYHAVRSDHRHSLSLAYPTLYLAPSAGPWLVIPQLVLSFLPTLVIFGRKNGAAESPKERLVASVALQTAVMVACSRVLTVQYFAWWIPFVGLLPFRRTVNWLAVACWIASLALWLAVAFCLEFLGSSWAIHALQFCGSLFFVAQMNLVGSLH
jgi:phosphatidylinositol glycan class M